MPRGRHAVGLIVCLALAMPANAQADKTGSDIGSIVDDRLAKLSSSDDEATAMRLARDILASWRDAGGATSDLLMRRGLEYRDLDQLDRARDMFDRVVLIEPDLAAGWATRATIFLGQGQLAEAAADLETAIGLEPNHFLAWQLLGQTFELADRPGAALEAYRQALALHPFQKIALEAVERLAPLVDGRHL